jgi:probable DNA repair protein
MNDLMTQIRAGATVVTATRRLQHHLLDVHGAAQQGCGKLAWPTPAVHFWDDWVATMWQASSYAQRGDERPLSLHDHQELWLWEHSIRVAVRERPGGDLLSVPATGRAAREAWRTAHDWGLRLRDISGPPGSDSAAFAAWAGSFRRRCRAGGWLSRAELPARLGALISEGGWRPPLRRLVLAGFDQLPPARAGLIQALQSSGVSVHRAAPTAREGSARVVACADPESELAAAAHWARRCLERGDGAPIGVVVPDLSRRRDQVERIFDRTLHPDHPWGTGPETGRAFHLSLGCPLSRFPLVDAALSALQLTRRPLRREHLAVFFDTAFSNGSESEAGSRSRLARLLQESGPERLEWEEVMHLLQRDGSACPLLTETLQRLARLSAVATAQQTPRDWAEYFHRWLEAAGWPGDASLQSAEQQTREAWYELLTAFAGLGLVATDMPLNTALARIQQMAQGRVFQPQSASAPVQVMGLMETAGFDFVRLWLTGMDDTSWPPPPRPDPFLPLGLQIERGLPHADARAELAFAEQTTRRLLRCAGEIRVSFATQQDDRQARISPLFAALPPAPHDEPVPDDVDFVALLQRHRPPLVTTADTHGPALPSSARVRGGANLFRDQSACPFRAFARYRLQARAYPVAEAGISALDRGNIVHQCLHSLWAATRSQQRLRAIEDSDLDALILRHVDRVLNDPRWKSRERFRSRLLDLERQRLVGVLREWLQRDAERPAFRVIATEIATDATIAGLTVRLRADRIDEYGDGAQLIIDYKTGAQPKAHQQWLGDRPDEPQLPLYLLAADRPIEALALAVVRRGDCQLTGLAREQAPAPKVEPVAQVRQLAGLTWDQLVARWRTVLERLATGFIAGAADVDPRDAEACRHCDVHPLCRIHEAASAEEDADD